MLVSLCILYHLVYQIIACFVTVKMNCCDLMYCQNFHEELIDELHRHLYVKATAKKPQPPHLSEYCDVQCMHPHTVFGQVLSLSQQNCERSTCNVFSFG